MMKNETTSEQERIDLHWGALHDALAQTQVMVDAWWRVNDAVRILQKHNAFASNGSRYSADALEQVIALDRPMYRLQSALKRMLDQSSQARDGLALAGMTATPEDEALLRERLKQADLNLSTLYKQLQALCHHNAAPLEREVCGQAAQDLPPLWDAQVDAKLDYLLDENNPLYDDQSNNILATQEAVSWHIRAEASHVNWMDDDPSVDNWLDYKHPWMQRQGWLTHDVLEHNYGHNPRFGVAALLQTGTVWVEVHTVRSYAFDLQTGEFIAQPKD